MKTQDKCVRARLKYLRREIQAERISYGEIAELQSLRQHIPEDDLLLLQWAGVPEHEEPSPVYVIEYRSRSGRTKKARYATLDRATATANEIFKQTGIVVAITEEAT